MSVFLLISAFMHLSAVLTTSPAFNEDERQRSAEGTWRVSNTAAHYIKSDYLMELGLTYLTASRQNAAPSTKETAVVGPDARTNQIETALDLFNQSLRLDPGNAISWAHLAKAQAANSDFEALRGSLARSWHLAPHNPQLAPLRLQLAVLINQANLDSPDQTPPLTEQEIASARKDSITLNTRSPTELEAVMAITDPLRTILGTLNATSE